MVDDLSVTEIDRIKHDKMDKAKQFEEKIYKAVEVGENLEEKVNRLVSEMCEGPNCLKNRVESKFGQIEEKISKIEEKTSDLVCDKCGYVGVPPLASFCPNCSAPIYEWKDDNGEDIKGWKHWDKRNN